MSAEQFFKDMYFDIWQSNAVEKFDQYYSKSFHEIIDTTDDHNEPLTPSH